MMTIRYTGKKGYPFEVLDVSNNKIYLDDFLLRDDEDWENFIDSLNFYRNCYVDGTIERLLQNVRKSQK